MIGIDTELLWLSPCVIIIKRTFTSIHSELLGSL